MAAEADAALSYSVELPMRWTPAEVAADGPERERLAEANLRVLGQIAQLEERGAPADDPSPQDLEIARLHAKMDLLLAAIGELAPRFLDRPARRWLQLSWNGLQCLRADGAPEAGSTGIVELYLHPVSLQPLRWPALALPGDERLAALQFLPLGAAAQHALERHVFQHHRRAVAESRSAGRPPR